MICTRCGGTGFLNDDQIPDEIFKSGVEFCLSWIEQNKNETDAMVCDCCGDGEIGWYGTPGEHYGPEDPMGKYGPYRYNGGLCECH